MAGKGLAASGKKDLATWLFADGRQQTVRGRGGLLVQVERGHRAAQEMGTELAGWRMAWRADPQEMAEAEAEELKVLEALIGAL